jgi:hypothetical protein
MVDVVAELIEFLLAAGGVPGPESIEGQRRARLLATIVALTAVIGGYIVAGTTAGVALVAAGSIMGLWTLSFSLVDLMKEFPPVQWQSVTAIVVATTALAVALAYALGVARVV